MRASRLLLLLPFALLSLISVADTVNDPRILIQPGGGSTPIHDVNFSFSLTGPDSPCTLSDGNFICDFVNETGQPWTDLKLTITPPQSEGGLSCDGGVYFASCTFSENGGIFEFSNGSIPDAPGHTNLTSLTSLDGDLSLPHFELIFEGFSPTTGVNGNANSLPEPGTLALLASGIVGLIVRRRNAF